MQTQTTCGDEIQIDAFETVTITAQVPRPAPDLLPSRHKVDNDSCSMSEGDNSRPHDSSSNSVEFNKDIYHFYMLYGVKNRGSTLASIMLFFLCLFVLAIQFLSLHLVTFAFGYWSQTYYGDQYSVDPDIGHTHLDFDMFGQLYPQWSHRFPYQQFTYRTSVNAPYAEDLNYYFDFDSCVVHMPTFVLFKWTVAVISCILGCFVMRSFKPFASSLWAFLCYNDDDQYPRGTSHYVLSMFLIASNFVLLFNIVVFVANVMSFALYFGIAIDWEIFLFALVAVCILQVDEWIYHWIVAPFLNPTLQTPAFWKVEVNEHCSTSIVKFTAFGASIGVSWMFAWYLTSNQIYYWAAGWWTWLLKSYKFGALFFVIFVMLASIPYQSAFRRFLVHFVVADFMMILLSIVPLILMALGVEGVFSLNNIVYDVDWSHFTDLMEEYKHMGVTPYYPIYTKHIYTDPTTAITVFRVLCVVASVFCFINFVLSVGGYNGWFGTNRWGYIFRRGLSVLTPSIGLAAYIYWISLFGLYAMSGLFQLFGLFLSPVVIMCGVLNWREMWMNTKPIPVADSQCSFSLICYCIAFGLVAAYFRNYTFHCYE
eukprot:562230_1